MDPGAGGNGANGTIGGQSTGQSGHRAPGGFSKGIQVQGGIGGQASTAGVNLGATDTLGVAGAGQSEITQASSQHSSSVHVSGAVIASAMENSADSFQVRQGGEMAEGPPMYPESLTVLGQGRAGAGQSRPAPDYDELERRFKMLSDS